MAGISELAEEVTGLSVRRGNAHGLTGLSDVVRSPIYSTSVGLIQLTIKDSAQTGSALKQGRWFSSLWKRTRNWFSEYF
jgi:cell division protein FtsA